MRLSVIIPTLNEERTLGATLEALPADAERLVVDGGSTDRTQEIARDHRARVILAPRGRALQQNVGARATSGDVLLFLHADTRLPPEGPREIVRSIERGAVGGGFLGRFDSDHWSFRFGYPIRDFRARFFFHLYGDQGIFVRRDVFESLGGFRPWPILEDADFARRLRHRGPVRVIPYPILMSARRYLRYGIIRQHFKNFWIWKRYLLGVEPERLSRLYEQYWKPDPGEVKP